jgi:hypothetical protein
MLQNNLKSNQSDRLHIIDPSFIYGELSNVCKQENAHNSFKDHKMSDHRYKIQAILREMDPAVYLNTKK